MKKGRVKGARLTVAWVLDPADCTLNPATPSSTCRCACLCVSSVSLLLLTSMSIYCCAIYHRFSTPVQPDVNHQDRPKLLAVDSVAIRLSALYVIWEFGLRDGIFGYGMARSSCPRFLKHCFCHVSVTTVAAVLVPRLRGSENI